MKSFSKTPISVWKSLERKIFLKIIWIESPTKTQDHIRDEVAILAEYHCGETKGVERQTVLLECVVSPVEADVRSAIVQNTVCLPRVQLLSHEMASL